MDDELRFPRNHGLFLFFRCPDCYESTYLELRSTYQPGEFLIVNGILGMLPFATEWLGVTKREHFYGVRCSRCRWTMPLGHRPSPEVQKRLKEITTELKKGKFQPTDYFKCAEKLAPEILEQIRTSGEHWNCRKCGEVVGATFTECWNCSAPAPEGAAQVDAEDSEVSVSLFKESDRPWEG